MWYTSDTSPADDAPTPNVGNTEWTAVTVQDIAGTATLAMSAMFPPSGPTSHALGRAMPLVSVLRLEWADGYGNWSLRARSVRSAHIRSADPAPASDNQRTPHPLHASHSLTTSYDLLSFSLSFENPGLDSREVIRRLEAHGWRLARVKGSHHHFKHATRPEIVTVKHPAKDFPIGTLKSIERQSGVELT